MGFSNLQTTSRLSSCCCTREVIMGIQNVKKLEISGDEDDYESFWESGLVNNLVHLHQLETLSLTGTYILWPRTLPASTPSAKSFPATLKKLNLTSTYLSWSYLDIIAELPNLEVLKLMGFACCGEGEEWHPIVMGFNRLKILLIERSFLKYWKATDDNFPVLERLVLINCKCLKEIPIEFAEIHSLQLIEVDLCLIELGESAARIRQQQQDLGNNPWDVCISHPRKYIVFVKQLVLARWTLTGAFCHHWSDGEAVNGAARVGSLDADRRLLPSPERRRTEQIVLACWMLTGERLTVTMALLLPSLVGWRGGKQRLSFFSFWRERE
ncbi:hypothetical protein T459_34093 [Capsicum annuum]|uniref:Uncharacterized protein n=1 Tax=Capsicum annuum TaxID=4072 RepID=A0A2G2XX79_CAPAN|nr:hypothetical protein T459_34093 [Capsicum annuum]